MIYTTKDIRKTQDRLYKHCKSQAVQKGNDYSGNDEDTFKNIRMVKEFKCAENDMQACLAQIINKVSRLSNFSQPDFVSQVKDESAFDTISDLHNYATYWLMFFEEEKKKKEKKK